MTPLQFALGDQNFYWRHRQPSEVNEAPPIPAFLPFSYGFDPDLQLITQVENQRVLDALEAAYLQDQNIGYMQEGHALADQYGGDFLRFIGSRLSEAGNGHSRILDIGCGGCYVLNQLKKQGYDVYGCDPTPMARRCGEQFGIPICSSFYPAPHSFGTMDLVVSSGLLEHVPNPIEILAAKANDLSQDGLVIISVPDSQPNIQFGDISMTMHEHLSYFDEESIRLMADRAGYDIVALERAKYGLSLYCCMKKKPTPHSTSSGEKSMTKFAEFIARSESGMRSFRSCIGPLLDDNDVSIGFYVPLRALPYLSTLKRFSGIRFFDDNPGVHNTYFDGFDVPIESFSDLQDRPVTHIFLMSLPHAEIIADRIRETFGDRISLYSLRSILTSGISSGKKIYE